MPVGAVSPPRHSRRSRSPRTGMPVGTVGTVSPPRHSRRSRSPRTGMPSSKLTVLKAQSLAAKLKAYRASASGKPLSEAMPRPDDGKAKADFTGDPEVGAKVEGRAISPSGPPKATAKVEGRAISPSGPSKAAKATHPGGARSKAKAAEKASGRPAPVKAAKCTKLTGLEGAWTVSRRQGKMPEMRFKVTCFFQSPDDKGSVDGMLCVNYRGEQPQDPQYVWLEMFHQSVIPVRASSTTVTNSKAPLTGKHLRNRGCAAGPFRVGGRTPPNGHPQ